MSLIQCHYDYTCSIWYNGLIKALTNKLQTTKNKLIRFVLNLDYRSHVGKNHFRTLNCLPVDIKGVLSGTKYLSKHVLPRLINFLLSNVLLKQFNRKFDLNVSFIHNVNDFSFLFSLLTYLIVIVLRIS